MWTILRAYDKGYAPYSLRTVKDVIIEGNCCTFTRCNDKTGIIDFDDFDIDKVNKIITLYDSHDDEDEDEADDDCDDKEMADDEVVW